MFSGKEEDRLMYLQELLDHPNIKGIFFARGGYGSIKILDQLKFNKFQENPKWLIGFSDITTILSHVTSLYQIPVIHGPMIYNFKTSSISFDSLLHKVENSVLIFRLRIVLSYAQVVLRLIHTFFHSLHADDG